MAKHEEDVVWERVLGLLSENGRLSRFYKLPRHEMRAYMKAGGAYAPAYLALIFRYVQNNEAHLARQFLQGLDPQYVFPMILNLVRAIKCWVETDNMDSAELWHGRKRFSPWKVAYA